MTDATTYFYLHGLASGPNSTKVQYLRDRWQETAFQVPDLNAGDFQGLTLSRQIRQVAELFPAASAPVAIIGSSLGGLTAAWLAQQYPQVERLVLFAPAFNFVELWLQSLGPDRQADWQQQGLSIYHHGYGCERRLDYQFIEDARRYDETQLQRPVPTLILHGRQDETIPIAASRTYAAPRPWVTLRELDSDHALTGALPDIWAATREFFNLPL